MMLAPSQTITTTRRVSNTTVAATATATAPTAVADTGASANSANTNSRRQQQRTTNQQQPSSDNQKSGDSNNRNRRGPRANKNKKEAPKDRADAGGSGVNNNNINADHDSSAAAAVEDAGTDRGTSSVPRGAEQTGKGRQRGRGGRQQPQQRRDRNATAPATKEAAAAEQQPAADVVVGKNRRKKNRKKQQQQQQSRSNAKKKKFPWRKHIPAGTVDPITLDSLLTLPYPPFALVASPPYVPVEEWPLAAATTMTLPDDNSNPKTCDDGDRTKATATRTQHLLRQQETEEERQQRIMREQWGDKLSSAAAARSAEEQQQQQQNDEEAGTTGAEGAAPFIGADNGKDGIDYDQKSRHYHLYDGRALAYYMVSQLQFIDPLNRRDVTRDELVNLDRYLRAHGFRNLNVCEAYDIKGVTLSTAGAAANTAAGRAAILQQEASILLSALFGGVSVSATAPALQSSQRPQRGRGGDLRSQYQAQEESDQQQHRPQQEWYEQEDTGIYGGAGVLVIDDDLNPGLRGSAPAFVPGGSNGAAGPNTLWSASNIRQTHGHDASVRAHEFPSLEATVPRSSAQQEHVQQQQQPAASSTKKKAAPPSKTLASISSAVKKTDPEELQRQFEAREEARRRAMMSTLTFGSNPAATNAHMQPEQGIPTTITAVTDALPTEGQLQRNKAIADALGVAPATVRSNSNLVSGWARPAGPNVEVDEFGNELNATIYPDSLIVQARERMGVLIKLEKKWTKFLLDDTSASLPLNPMDRPTRQFVHEYSQFWLMHTESFDREPNRYIHCVKLRDTRAPYPLLSEAARNWRGPQPVLQSTLPRAPASVVSGFDDHSLQQTAGQATRGREIPPAPQRQPLPLKPRTANLDVAPSSFSGAVTIGGAPTRTMTEPGTANSRFDSLSSGRERPKLHLAKRTAPLEMPPHQSIESEAQGYDVSEELRRREAKMKEKARKEQERIERQKRAVEAAFASDDERSHGRVGDSDSEWEEQAAVYSGGDSFSDEE